MDFYFWTTIFISFRNGWFDICSSIPRNRRIRCLKSKRKRMKMKRKTKCFNVHYRRHLLRFVMKCIRHGSRCFDIACSQLHSEQMVSSEPLHFTTAERFNSFFSFCFCFGQGTGPALPFVNECAKRMWMWMRMRWSARRSSKEMQEI